MGWKMGRSLARLGEDGGSSLLPAPVLGLSLSPSLISSLEPELERSSVTSPNPALRSGVPGGSESRGLASGSNCSTFPHQHLFQSRALCDQDLIKRPNLKEVLHLHGKLLQFGFSE